MARAKKSENYYARNRERIREQQSRYAALNRENKKKYNQRYRSENKEQIAQQRSEYRRTNKSKLVKKEYYKNNIDRFLLSNAKSRAKRLKLPFNLDLSDVLIPKSCPILKIPIIQETSKKDGSPSVDRKIPSLGYTKGNVQVISWRANNLKSNATLKELIALGKWAENEN